MSSFFDLPKSNENCLGPTFIGLYKVVYENWKESKNSELQSKSNNDINEISQDFN